MAARKSPATKKKVRNAEADSLVQNVTIRDSAGVVQRFRDYCEKHDMSLNKLLIHTLANAELPDNPKMCSEAEARMALALEQLVGVIDDFAAGKISLANGVRPRLARLADHIRTGKVC